MSAEQTTSASKTRCAQNVIPPGQRGRTAARYAEVTNVVVVGHDVLDVFPDSAAVNEALRALAPVIRRQRKMWKKAQRVTARS